MLLNFVTGLLILNEYHTDLKVVEDVIWATPARQLSEASSTMLLELGWFDSYVPESDKMSWGYSI